MSIDTRHESPRFFHDEWAKTPVRVKITSYVETRQGKTHLLVQSNFLMHFRARPLDRPCGKGGTARNLSDELSHWISQLIGLRYVVVNCL